MESRWRYPHPSPPPLAGEGARNGSFTPSPACGGGSGWGLPAGLPSSQRKAAVDDVDRAGRERGFVRGEIDRESGDLLRGAEPPHRLALDEGLARRLGAAS